MPSLAEMEKRFRVALLTGDVRTVDTLLDDTAILVGVDGQMYEKHRGLLGSLAEDLRITRLETLGSELREWENTGVAIITSWIESTFQGQPFSAVYCHTRVWRRNAHDAWHVLTSHCNIVQPRPSP